MTPACAGSTGAPRILVVDDEPLLGAVLRRGLRQCEVVWASSGSEALTKFASGERFDVILCDLVMPGVGGDDLYREVQRTAPEDVDRIIFIAGGATTESARRFIETVPNHVVDKPFDLGRLLEKILARVAARTL